MCDAVRTDPQQQVDARLASSVALVDKSSMIQTATGSSLERVAVAQSMRICLQGSIVAGSVTLSTQTLCLSCSVSWWRLQMDMLHSNVIHGGTLTASRC